MRNLLWGVALALLGVTLTLSGALSAQEAYFGLMGGRTAANLSEDTNHFGAMAGAFLQVDLSPHVGFRSEASWVRTGALNQTDLLDCHLHDLQGCIQIEETVDLEFAELNAMGRLSWSTDAVPPMGAELGAAVFGGGWLSTRVRGRFDLGTPTGQDFGHLVGIGLFWKYQRLLFQVDARSYHGERVLIEGGPKRKGSQLVFGLGYRIH